MKKLLTLFVLIFVCTPFVLVAFETEGRRFVGLNDYDNHFPDGYPTRREGNVRISAHYTRFIDYETYDRFCSLGGDEDEIDTSLEWALASYYSPAVIQIRPPQANAILPANNPKLADTKLGAAVFQELQILRFLGNTAAVTRHEAVLKFITDRKNVTRAEVETYYRNGIRALISGIVDEEFNKVSWLLGDKYNAVLTRNPQNGHYTLGYEGYFDGNKQIKTFSFASLEELPSKVRSNIEHRNDFNQKDIDEIKAQAALIPAVLHEKVGHTTIPSLKKILTDFYINPTRENYNKVIGMRDIYRDTQGERALEAEYYSFRNTLTSLHPALAEKVFREGR